MSTGPTSRQPGMMRHRSLLWVIPERYARCAGWVVASACVVSIIVVAMLLRPKPVVRHETPLAEALSGHLAMPVTVRSATLETSGEYTFADLAMGEDGAVLRAQAGTYVPPREDVPGRLRLQRGTLRVDLDAWLAGRTQPVVLMMHAARRKTGLWRVSLADFAVSLSLGKDSAVSLSRATVTATLTDGGDVHVTLSGVTGGARLALTFDASDDVQEITITGDALPWVATLLGPTVGELAQGLTSASGELKLRAGPLAAGSPHNWTLTATTTLSLDRLPPTLGLGELGGELHVNVVAVGRRGQVASCSAELAIPEDAGGRASARALRNLHYLFTGRRQGVADVETVHPFADVNLWLLVAPGQYVGISGTDTNRPAGLFAPDGRNLLPLPSVDVVPIRDFQDRLDELRRLWQRDHTS